MLKPVLKWVRKFIISHSCVTFPNEHSSAQLGVNVQFMVSLQMEEEGKKWNIRPTLRTDADLGCLGTWEKKKAPWLLQNQRTSSTWRQAPEGEKWQALKILQMMNLGSRQLLICLNGDNSKIEHMELLLILIHTKESGGCQTIRKCFSKWWKLLAVGCSWWGWIFLHVHYILQVATIFHAGILQSLPYALVITNIH